MGGCVSKKSHSEERYKTTENIVPNRKASEEEIKKGLIACFKWNQLEEPESERLELQEAISHFRQAIDLDPTYDRAFARLGNILIDDKKIAEAIAMLKKSLSLNPQNLRAKFSLLFCDEKNLIEIEPTIQETEAFLLNDARSSDDWAAKATALEFLSRKEEALAAYKEARRLDPSTTNPNILWNIVQLSPVTEEEIPTTLKYSDFLAELVPEAPFSILSTKSSILGNAYYLTHEKTYLNQSIDLISYILQHKPHWIDDYCTRGKLYIDRNQPGDAKLAAADFKTAQELSQDPSLLERLNEEGKNFVKSVLDQYRAALLPKICAVASEELNIVDIKSVKTSDVEKAKTLNKKIIEAQAEQTKLLAESTGTLNSEFTPEPIYMSSLDLRMQKIMREFANLQQQVNDLEKSKASKSEVSYAIKINLRKEEDEANIAKIKANKVLEDYHHAFTKTLYAAHNVALSIAGGGVVDDSNTISKAANIISLIPLPGSSAVGSLISAASASYTTAVKCREASKLTKVPSTTEFEDIVLHISIKVTLDRSNVYAMNHPPEKVKSWFSDIAAFCEKVKCKIDDTLYSKGFDSNAAKLGNLHARKIMDAVYKEEIDLSATTILEDAYNLIIGDIGLEYS
ncbi:MAG: Tetratricopeptide repeat [Pseudomonadota bacterium]|jgi:tetratricopeptide (TPR) repeat protein